MFTCRLDPHSRTPLCDQLYAALRGRDSQSPSLVSLAYAASTVAVLMCR